MEPYWHRRERRISASRSRGPVRKVEGGEKMLRERRGEGGRGGRRKQIRRRRRLWRRRRKKRRKLRRRGRRSRRILKEKSRKNKREIRKRGSRRKKGGRSNWVQPEIHGSQRRRICRARKKVRSVLSRRRTVRAKVGSGLTHPELVGRQAVGIARSKLRQYPLSLTGKTADGFGHRRRLAADHWINLPSGDGFGHIGGMDR